jgi:glycine/D-amino acid oxidase-like deaminating enzyme
MDLRSGYPLSLIKYGIPFDYPKLYGDIHTDVAVIGGGISGALAALYLCREGFDTVVLDARTAGLGSTCASTSLLLYEIDTPLHELRLRSGQARADRAYELSKEAVDSLGSLARELSFDNFQWTNSLYCAATMKQLNPLQAEYEARLELGLAVDWLDSAALERKYGIACPGAIISQCAAKTDAYQFTHAIHQHNIGKGVRVFDRTSMVGYDAGKRGVRLMTDEGCMVRAKYLVFANGYEALEQLGGKLASLHSTFVVASEQVQPAALGGLQDVIMWNMADPYFYMRTTADNRVVIGGRDEPFYSPARRDRMIRRKTNQLDKDFRKLVPRVPFKQEFSWAGSFASTPDGLPYIGMHPAIRRSYFALGFGGNGISFAMLAAKLIADMICGRVNKDAGLFIFNRVQ